MKFKFLFLILALTASVLLSGCQTPRLEPGGAYAPTNSVGQVVYNDVGLAVADASYKLAYQTVLGFMKFERDNRAAIAAINPSVGASVKAELDKLRPQVVSIDLRWAKARKAYRLNPTPAGLSTIQTILSEIQRLIPAVQSQIVPATRLISKP